MEVLTDLIRDFSNINEFSKPSADMLEKLLLSKDVKLSLQLRALYFCRDLSKEDCSRILQEALNIHNGTFMRHEIAYVLGQAGCRSAIDILVKLLEDPTEHSMVRHEAAEAIAAIGSIEHIELIRQYSTDQCPIVRDTCILALHSLESHQKDSDFTMCGYTSVPKSTFVYRAVDPVSCKGNKEDSTLSGLTKDLMDESIPLYKRYEALFQIRSMAVNDAALAIGNALVNDASSEVFRHECAFVLGQLQLLESVEFLIKCLSNLKEQEIARHEAALALGSCAAACKDSKVKQKIIDSLELYSNDCSKVVVDSCLVALDIIDESSVC